MAAGRRAAGPSRTSATGREVKAAGADDARHRARGFGHLQRAADGHGPVRPISSAARNGFPHGDAAQQRRPSRRRPRHGRRLPIAGSLKTGHAFLDDIAHNAVPEEPQTGQSWTPDDATASSTRLADAHGQRRTCTTTNCSTAHFITGDGRGNENIGAHRRAHDLPRRAQPARRRDQRR